MKYLFLFVFLVYSYGISFSQQVIISKKDAEVWGTSQVIKGKLSGKLATEGTLLINDDKQIVFYINQSDSSFQIPVSINEGINNIIARVDSVQSDTLKLKLAYKILPSVFAYTVPSGNQVLLKGEQKDNPKNSQLTFEWIADPLNPAEFNIVNALDTTASVTVDSNAPEGEYYFNLLTMNGEGDTVKARTFFTITSSGIKPFEIKKDHAAWIDSAVIYEITPRTFVYNGKFNDITAKIPDIVRLGINTMWLQPVYATQNRGQGYDIIDYFKVRSDLGSKAELRNLISTAKSYGLKVLFDFVPNHSSIHHPYAKNSSQYGTDSHYWDYYQRETDNAPYSRHYNFYNGFINYFWAELPNLNFDNPEVQRWITTAAKYWVEEFDIDGYRFDAVWGVTARNPQFTKDLRIALKTIKPELLMLAEDKATQEQVFDERFDVAFDWMPEEEWVSHWAWQTIYSQTQNYTIFNHSTQSMRPTLLRRAITNNGVGFASNAKVLRFMANNDVHYFMTHHDIERTRMAAALLFTLHGIPLVYNGDEIGKTGHPYSTGSIFLKTYPMDYSDQHNLFPYYQKLIRYRKTLPALYNDNYSEITVSPSSYIFGFRRWHEDQNIFTVLNLSSSERGVEINIPVPELNLDSNKTWYMTDLISGSVISAGLNYFNEFSVTIEPYGARIFYLSDTVFTVTGGELYAAENIPEDFVLNQNYPNPFNPITSISFNLPASGQVDLRIYDLLGSEIAVLIDGEKEAGEHKISFDATGLPSGVYLYRINYSGNTAVKKMLLLK